MGFTFNISNFVLYITVVYWSKQYTPILIFKSKYFKVGKNTDKIDLEVYKLKTNLRNISKIYSKFFVNNTCRPNEYTFF